MKLEPTLFYLLLTLAPLTLVLGCGDSPEDETSPHSTSIDFGTPETIDFVSWNIEAFPKQGAPSADAVVRILADIQPDVVAVQEIWSQSHLEWVASTLGPYQISATADSEETGLYFLYNSDVVTVTTSAQSILQADAYDFGWRAPVQIDVKIHGKSIRLINLHYKCCGDNILSNDNWDEEGRRLRATGTLKRYLDRLPTHQAVVVLGDWNDALIDTDENNVFRAFLSDPVRYRFADESIAKSENSDQWSYPSYPSHLDHILLNRPLIPALADTRTQVETLLIDRAFTSELGSYYEVVSDHRPVGLRFYPEAVSSSQ